MYKRKDPALLKRKKTHLTCTEEQLIKARNAGRPPAQIDEKEVFELATHDCTVGEIAAVLNCTRETLYDRFSDVMQKGREHGNAVLRKMMSHKATGEDGKKYDTTMLIWLSKQRLGHRERAADEAQQVIFNISINEVP